MTPEAARLADIYSDATGIKTSGALLKNLGNLADLQALAAFDDAVLRDSALALSGRRGFGFALSGWLEAAHRRSRRGPAHQGQTSASLLAALPSTADRRLRWTIEEIGGYVDESALRMRGRHPQSLVEAAKARIVERVQTGEFVHGAFARRQPKWRRYAATAAGLIPTISADDIEQLIVPLLSLTHPEAQFSYRRAPSGQVFASWMNGFHRRDEERVYVTGLSDVLDTATTLVQDHREGMGGRIFINQGRVACAECRRPIAWIGSAQGDECVPATHRPSR
ncbi:hypothetical protein [Phycicoccus sp. Soil802]|uniref:hypothetical protein n=1 Tax=Phycicoccus sp. Soil802 TaxID=1736414 RepID=UPI000703368E|nr:hypothetical protein [Phycicoccus sp. Soil802]KRF29487.1 hypothetical protein ASG91_00160 [Phycicoccus sp. Soil802]